MIKAILREEGPLGKSTVRTSSTLRWVEGVGWKIVGEHSSAIAGVERATLVEE